MFKAKFNDKKFKTNVRLCINRLKLVEKKKTEMALKARKEIADYIKISKTDRARIRVEHIIREDYLVEGLEISEMFLDLILARVGLINLSNEIDPGMAESISSVIWVQPRIITECPELKIVCDELGKKYGKEYMQQCRSGMIGTVSKKLQKKLDPHAPPRSLVENYLIEIAKNYNVDFEPDRAALLSDELPAEVRMADLIDINVPDKWGNGPDTKPPRGGGGGGGMAPMQPEFGVYQPPAFQQPQAFSQPGQPPKLPDLPPAVYPTQPSVQPFQYPTIQPTESMRKASDSLPGIPGETPSESHLPSYNSATIGTFPMRSKEAGSPGTPGVPEPSPSYPAATNNQYDDVAIQLPEIPDLPDIPRDSNNGNDDDNGGNADFDDLSARFEALKRK